MKKSILGKWKIRLVLIPSALLALIFSLGVPGEEEPLVVVIVDDKAVVPEQPEQIVTGPVEETNVALQSAGATATASSYYPDLFIPDKYAPWRAIDGIKGVFDNEWACFGNIEAIPPTPWWQVNLPKPANIHTVRLHDRVVPGPWIEDVLNATLIFSDGSTIAVGEGTPYPINPDGEALIITFQEKSDITWIRFQITNSIGPNPGLSEFEAFSYIQQPDTIIPAQSLYTQTKDKVEEYCQALVDDGYVVMLHKYKEIEDYEVLKKYLQDMYNNPTFNNNDDTLFGAEDLSNAKLNGAILIGDLPTAYFEVDEPDEGGVFPVDLYFMDLDGTWGKTEPIVYNNVTYDPVFNNHTGNTTPEIWVSRIPTYNGENFNDKILLITDYMDKNLQFRSDLKNGVLMDGKALLITSDSQAHLLTPAMRCLYKNSTISDIKYNIDKDYFLGLISGLGGTTYDFMDINAGFLGYSGLCFENRFTPYYYIDALDLEGSGSTPKFVLLRVPGAANYIFDKCLASSLIFNPGSDGICVLGYSSISPHPQYFSYDSFYYNAAKVSLGDAFKEGICKAIIEYKMGTKTKYCDETIGAVLDTAVHGFTIHGDPTFRLGSILNQDKKGSAEEAKSYLAKGITGGNFSKPDILPNNINFAKEGNSLVIYLDWIYETPKVVNVTVASDGFFTAKDNKYVQIASWDYKVKIDNQLAQDLKFIPVKAGVSHRNSIKTTAKLPLDNKTHQVEITLDTTNKISERNENNNKITRRFYCGYKLDLKPSRMDFIKGDSFYKDIDIPTWCNDYNNLRIRIENNGLVPINLLGTEGKTFLKVYAENKNEAFNMLTNQEVKFQYNNFGQYPGGYVARYLDIAHIVVNTTWMIDPDDSIPPSFTFKSIVDDKNTLKKYLKLPI